MVSSECENTFVLRITDAFTKFTVITTVLYNKAETVARSLFEFGSFTLRTERGAKSLLINSYKLFNLLSNTTMTLAYPQCKAQVEEVFSKTVKKYLASFMDDSKLNWEEFLPALALSYNII
jgi:hypothetical protein